MELITKIAIFAPSVPHQCFPCINHCTLVGGTYEATLVAPTTLIALSMVAPMVARAYYDGKYGTSCADGRCSTVSSRRASRFNQAPHDVY